MGNNLKKKTEAKIHNTVNEIAENILQIGECRCEKKGMLFMYLKSSDENIFKYYCTECTEVGDIREPLDKDKIYFGPQQILNTLSNYYTEEKIQSLFNKQLNSI